MRTTAGASLLALVLAGAPASAQEPAPPPVVPELRYTLWLDATVTGVALTWWLGSALAQDQLAATACRWCDPPGFDTSMRDLLRWQNTDAADIASDVAAGMQPLLMFGLDALAARAEGVPRAAWVDALLISEATSIALAVNQTVKFIAGRERPFVHALPEAEKPFTEYPSSNNLSFYSAHASFTFALAVSAGTIASMRRYRLAPWIWTVGLGMATVTAYLRIAADRHYASDVVMGAAVGSLAGAAVPYLFHGPRRLMVAPGAVTDGLTLVARGVF